MGFIYTITCINTNKVYVGSTTRKLSQRWGDHKSSLRTKIHANIHLQRAWNKYGESSFVFEELEEWPNEVLLSFEQFWMNCLNVYKFGFNRNCVAGSSYGTKRSEESNRKNSEAGCWKKANIAWTGCKHTEKTKSIIKEKRSRQIIKHSQETKDKIRDAHIKLGRTNLPIHRVYSSIIAYNDTETLTFKDTTEAKLYFNLKFTGPISRVLKGERSEFKGYKWKVQLKSGELMESPNKDNHEPS